MKVLLINGSPRKEGNTEIALAEVAKQLTKEGIASEIVWIGNKPIRGCIACGQCEVVCGGDALILYGAEKSIEELLSILMKDKEFYDNSGGGVTLSGGECLLYADFCAELLKKLKESNVHTAVDTCGFVAKKALDKVIPYTDIFLYDIKAFFKRKYLLVSFGRITIYSWFRYSLGETPTFFLKNLLK